MLVEVALPLPMPRTFTYLAEEAVAPGTRVLVPFSGRRLVGWVTGETTDAIDAARVRPLHRVLEPAPSVPDELLKLCAWIAGYYIVSMGLVLRAALPVALSSARRDQPPVKTRRIVRLTQELPSLQQREAFFGRAQRQREAFETLESMGGSSEIAHLADQLGFSSSVLKGLVQRGVAEYGDAIVQRDPFAEMAVGPAPALSPTPAQRAALDALCAASVTADSKPYLLHGVTGSGKTLVYIELLREVVERQGRGAIVLVPEISLTPQAVSRFRAVFGDKVAVLHSALSDGERFDAWRALHTGQRSIAVGARSAIFAPVRDLGAIIVDEEHESTYKQSDIEPRYHAREVAVVRAGMAGAVCVLGSATPSLESWHNAERGKYHLLALPERVEGRPMPPVRVIDLRKQKKDPNEPKEVTARNRILSPELVAAIDARLLRGEQTILLLNRRGYSTFVQCADCGHVWHCPQCNVSLTYHRTLRRLVCHYCFYEEPPPARCDACGSGDLTFRGVGTEQVERTVGETFPTARVARMDVDTTSGKWAHHQILDRVEKREVDILLGTQMIAKGLDFPHVTLVGVVNADVGLNLPDFRASERTFQLLTQVAGRAGRGALGGEVLVQTALPTHYAVRAALDHDYHTFAARELDERAHPQYPPHCRLANIVLSGIAELAAQEAAADAARWVEELIAGDDTVQLTGPAPCPIDRVRGRWRWHFLLRSRSARSLGSVLERLHREYPLKGGAAQLRMAIDRDPVQLL